MGRPGKFKKEQVAEMINLVKEQAVIEKDVLRMKISDDDMCSILCAAGFEVNISYVKRLRQRYEIIARNKYFNDDVAKIHIIMKQYVSDNGSNESSWKMTVSDATMAGILKEAGYDVNAKYVERTRRSLGIEPLGNRGGARPGAGRPSDSVCADMAYARVMANHYRDTYRLSDHQGPSGALPGQTGVDKHSPKFGHHTTDLEDAKKRKDARLARLAQNAGSIKTTIDRATTDDGCSNINDIKRLFAEEVKRSSSLYGRTGTQGGKQNTRTAQAYSSL